MSTFTVKLAGSEVSLEKSIANIAYAKLSDRSPKLFDYVKGFQLLDQTEDRNQAVGIFGFQVGDKTFRVPIFYRNGRIFGTEIIMPDHKTFRPLNDHWVQYLISREPDNPGEPTRSSYRSSAPSLWQLSVPPTKWASENPEVTKALAHIKLSADNYKSAAESVLLSTLKSNKKASQSFYNMLSLYPEVKEAAFSLYSKEELKEACKAALPGNHLLEKKAIDIEKLQDEKLPKPKLIVFRFTKITKVKIPSTYTNLTGKEKQTLLGGENVYRDERDPTGISDVFEYRETPGFKKLKNPTKNGIYPVAMPEGGSEDCAVLGPITAPSGGGDDVIAVIRLSDKRVCLSNRSRVFVKGPAKPYEEFCSFLESGSTLNTVGDLPSSDPFIIYDECGKDFTVPLRTGYGNNATGNRTDVHICCELPDFQHAFSWYPLRFPLTNGNPKWDRPGYQNGPYKYVNNQAREDRIDKTQPLKSPKSLVLVPKTNRIHCLNNAVMVPRESKFMVVKAEEYNDSFCPSWDTTPTHFDDNVYLDDDYDTSVKKAGMDIKKLPIIKVAKKDDGITISDPRKNPLHDIQTVLTPLDAEADLVELHGLKPEKAKKIVKEAMDKGLVRAAIKYANPYLATPLVQEPPGQDVPHLDRTAGSVGLFHNGINTVRPVSAQVHVPSLQGTQLYTLIDPFSADEHLGPAPLEESQYHKRSDFQNSVYLMKVAAKEKVKDLFDSATLAVILKNNSIDSTLDTILTKTLDYINWVGRMLCHTYWNYDKYAERFGKEDTESIIDRLRDLLEKTGDLYLVLEERDSGSRVNSGINPEDIVD